MGIFEIIGFTIILGLVVFITNKVKELLNRGISVSEMYIKHQEVGFDICDRYFDNKDEPFIIVESGLEEFIERTKICRKISAFLLLSYALSYESREEDKFIQDQYSDDSVIELDAIDRAEKIKDSNMEMYNALNEFYE